MAYNNISIKESVGMFYTKVNVPTEGYEQVDWQIGERSGTSYHKTFNKVSGKLSRLVIEKANFDGNPQFLKLSVKENGTDDISIISIPLEYSDNSLTKRVKALAPLLINLKEGMDVEISLNTTKRNAKEKLYPSVYIKEVGKEDNIGWAYHPYNDVPALEKKTVRGNDVYNSEAQDEFIFNKIQEAILNFPLGGAVAPTDKPAEKTAPAPAVDKPVNGKAPVEVDMDDDSLDLPF